MELPEQPEPEDDPLGYAEYLRRRVIAIARWYVLDSSSLTRCAQREGVVEDSNSYSPHRGKESIVQFAELCKAIGELDAWKKEHGINEID